MKSEYPTWVRRMFRRIWNGEREFLNGSDQDTLVKMFSFGVIEILRTSTPTGQVVVCVLPTFKNMCNAYRHKENHMSYVVSRITLYLQSVSKNSKHSNRIQRMINSLNDNADKWPIDKTHRWIGFIQGILFADGLLNIDEECDRTREIFHEYYRVEHMEIPESVDLN